MTPRRQWKVGQVGRQRRTGCCRFSASRSRATATLTKLITRMKLRAPKGEGALTLDELDGSTTGLVALVGRAGARDAGGTASAVCWIAWSALFGRDRVFVELQRHFRRDEEADNAGARRAGRRRSACRSIATNGVRFATPADAAALRRAHLHSSPHHARARRPAAGAERGAVSQAARRHGGALRRSPRRGRPHARARRSSAVHDGRPRLPLSGLSGAARRDAGVVPAPDARRSARAIAIVRITIGRARRSRASSISSRSSTSPAIS